MNSKKNEHAVHGASARWQKDDLLYEGKGKKVFQVRGAAELLWLEFKDSLTAFNAQKKGSFTNKGVVNREVASLVFRYLEKQNIATHWVADIGENAMICHKLQMIPLEVVVRNRVAGSFAKRFGLPEGKEIPGSIVEFFYKSDALEDPFISDEQALYLKTVAGESDLSKLKALGRKINLALCEFYRRIGVDLVDFKIEFGVLPNGGFCLGDEITPDSCRLWDLKTGEKLDKDRFRRDLGRVAESYEEVLARLREGWGKEL